MARVLLVREADCNPVVYRVRFLGASHGLSMTGVSLFTYPDDE